MKKCGFAFAVAQAALTPLVGVVLFNGANASFQIAVICALALIYIALVVIGMDFGRAFKETARANYAQYLELRKSAGQSNSAAELQKLDDLSRMSGERGGAYWADYGGLWLLGALTLYHLVRLVL